MPDSLPPTTPKRIHLGLGGSLWARQLTTAFAQAPDFSLQGVTTDANLLLRDIACAEHAPDLCLISADLLGCPLAVLIDTLTRMHRCRVLVLDSSEVTTPELQPQGAGLIEAGALQVHRLHLNCFGELDRHAVDRIMHLAALLANTKQLDPLRKKGNASPTPAHPALPLPGYFAIGIASSTDGLRTFETLLGTLPRSFRLPILVAQHLRSGTEVAFSECLQKHTHLEVTLVQGKQRLEPGHLYVAPSHRHLVLTSPSRMDLDAAPDEPFCPSANLLLRSMATHLGAHAIGIILTGMGADGADGLLAIRRAGGRTLVQDRQSSSVFGMPEAATRLQAAERILPITEIGPTLCRWLATEFGPP